MSDERDREYDYGFEVDPPVYTFYAEEKKPTRDSKKENSETSSKDNRIAIAYARGVLHGIIIFYIGMVLYKLFARFF